jgi:predicted nucleotidyltransferase
MNETKKIKNFLKDEKNIVFAYIFGSYVNGNYHKNSDIDIALFFDEYSFDNYLDITHKLEKLLYKKVDIVVLNNSKNIYLLEDIIRNSIVIKDSHKRDDFELKRWHEILDFKELNARLEVA